MYDDSFFDPLTAGIIRSAHTAVPVILDVAAARTVLDVGCGYGHWAQEFMRHGCDVTAVDGPHIPPDRLCVPTERFHAVNLADDGALTAAVTGPFDLVICLEVAEHLPEWRAVSFVAELVALSNRVVFSAAVPGQPAVGHVTCRWPSWWAHLFATHGYFPSTTIRESLWNADDVDVWYRQNMVLFTNQPGHGTGPVLLDVIHPDMWGWFAPIGDESIDSDQP